MPNQNIKKIIRQKSRPAAVIDTVLKFCRCILPYTLIFFSANPLAAGNVLNITENREYPLQGTFLEILEDKEKNLSIEDVTSFAFIDKFRINKQETINLGYTSSAYWIRFSLRNNIPEKNVFYLEIAYALLDYISLFSPDPEAVYTERKYGQYILFSEREVKHRNFVFKIPLQSGTNRTYYLRVETEDSFTLPIRLYTEEAFIEKEPSEQIVIGFLYGILIVMLLYNFCIYIFAKDKDYLYLVLFILSFILYIISENGLAYEYIWPSLPWWSKRAIPFAVSLVIITSSFFVQSFLKTKEIPWLDRIISLFKILGIIGIPIALGARYYYSIMYMVIVIAFYSLILIFTGFISIRRNGRSAVFFLIAWSFLLIGTNVYALKTFGVLPETFLTKYGVPIGAAIQMILLSISLADKIYIMKNELKDLNNNLEAKVRKRTEQLKVANEELAGTMKEIETINENLIKSNIKLELSQKNAERDMELAINVQAKFFPKCKILTKEWDIACIYQPSAGVSGDLYEFYRHNGNILGVGLFDISGHGISAGLITLLAKTIIYNRFMEMKDRKLSHVLESINESLINELKNVDNYLTGILLRFRDNKVEYVNGGHPELIIKQGKSGNVNVVNIKNRDIRGMILGVENMESRFNSITFEMDKGSYLLLYSDCLIEATNHKMEAYEMENLMSAFRDAPSDTAEEILNYILEDFNNFTGKTELLDDLTVIIIKKLV